MAPRDEPRWSIYAATAANVLIAVTKLGAAAITGSGAMFSEGLHSIVDTVDELFLLLGLRLSRRPPSRAHPYGHGRDVYFWSLVVAMTILGMGGGVSIYQGIHHLIAPHPIDASAWSYGVLGAAFAFEGTSWLIARREFRRARARRHGFWRAIERSKDPTSFIVVLEDSAALIGIGLAAAGITLARLTGEARWDAAASIAIGALLVAVAIVLGRETWSLLLGESAAPELVASVHRMASQQPGFARVREPRTVHLAPDLVHVDLDVEVDPSRTADELVRASRELEAAVRRAHPEVQRLSLRFPLPGEPDLLPSEG